MDRSDLQASVQVSFEKPRAGHAYPNDRVLMRRLQMLAVGLGRQPLTVASERQRHCSSYISTLTTSITGRIFVFVVHLFLMISFVLLVVWLTIGDEIQSTIGGSLDYLLHPLERKLRHARKTIAD